MKKFETSGRVLSKKEMKNILGGTSEEHYCTTTCIGTVGQWYYTANPTCDQIRQDIQTYCRSGQATVGNPCSCG